MSAGRPPVWVLLQAQLRADPRKTAVLALLIVVMAVVYGRWIFRSKPAGAAPVGTAVLPSMVVSDSAAITVPPALRLSRPLVRQVDRDPFAFDPARYPLVPGAGSAPVGEPVPEPGDAGSAPTGLVLQSTLCGPSPAACVNGKVVRRGEVIEGFVVEGIEPDHVVIRRDGARWTLWLK